MKNWLIILLAVITFGCKQKKADLSGNEPVKIKDFIGAFTIIESQFSAADSTITRIADSTIIGYKVFTQFIPDSVLTKMQVTQKATLIQPVGRIEKQKEIYLLATFTHHKKTILATFVFDKKYKFLAAKQLLANTADDAYNHFISINKEPTFLISREKLSADKQLQFTRVGWVYNNSGNFMVVINDSNEDERKNSVIINRSIHCRIKINSAAIMHATRKNFISLRDRKDANSYMFFIHFEKEDGSCTGELKGVLKMKTPTTAIYAEGGDPCVIDFTLKETISPSKNREAAGTAGVWNVFLMILSLKEKKPKPREKNKPFAFPII